MGIVAEFVESDALGWDITKEEFLAKALEELPMFPGVLIVISAEKTIMVKKEHIVVKIVGLTNNGGA